MLIRAQIADALILSTLVAERAFVAVKLAGG